MLSLSIDKIKIWFIIEKKIVLNKEMYKWNEYNF